MPPGRRHTLDTHSLCLSHLEQALSVGKPALVSFPQFFPPVVCALCFVHSFFIIFHFPPLFLPSILSSTFSSTYLSWKTCTPSVPVSLSSCPTYLDVWLHGFFLVFLDLSWSPLRCRWPVVFLVPFVQPDPRILNWPRMKSSQRALWPLDCLHCFHCLDTGLAPALPALPALFNICPSPLAMSYKDHRDGSRAMQPSTPS